MSWGYCTLSTEGFWAWLLLNHSRPSDLCCDSMILSQMGYSLWEANSWLQWLLTNCQETCRSQHSPSARMHFSILIYAFLNNSLTIQQENRKTFDISTFSDPILPNATWANCWLEGSCGAQHHPELSFESLCSCSDAFVPVSWEEAFGFAQTHCYR